MLAKAKLDVAYFVLYRPELCGTSIWDDLHKMSTTILHTKCCIKWVVISRTHPCNAEPIDTSRSIDLAKRSPTGLSQTLSLEPSQSSSDPPVSPPELEMPPPAQELLLRDSVSV